MGLYKKEFVQDVIETYCWVGVYKGEIDDVTQIIDELSPELIARLMRDIPGEAG